MNSDQSINLGKKIKNEDLGGGAKREKEKEEKFHKITSKRP